LDLEAPGATLIDRSMNRRASRLQLRSRRLSALFGAAASSASGRERYFGSGASVVVGRCASVGRASPSRILETCVRNRLLVAFRAKLTGASCRLPDQPPTRPLPSSQSFLRILRLTQPFARRCSWPSASTVSELAIGQFHSSTQPGSTGLRRHVCRLPTRISRVAVFSASMTNRSPFMSQSSPA